MSEVFEKYREQLKNVWNTLTRLQKIIISTLLVATIIVIFVVSFMGQGIAYEPLFTELGPKDAASIKSYLDKNNVPYRITGNGSVIEVEKSRKYAIRMDISNAGAMPTNGTVGLEIFDSTKIGATEFDKKLMFLRAQKGELERTIKNLSQIKKAQVNITPGNDSPFLEEKVEAKASVLLQLESFESVNEENIKSIIILVASAVEGLKKENVEVVDTRGNILSDRVDFSSDDSAQTKKRIAYKKQLEKDLEKSASGVLGIIGRGNFRIRVNLTLDYDKESYNKEIFSTPTIDGEQQRTGLLRSTQNQSENYSGEKKSGGEGVPGTTSNIPGYVGKDEKGSDGSYNKSNIVANYELNKQSTIYQKSTGMIKRMTVSVMINKKADYFKDVENVDSQKIRFRKMVETAVGLNARRGDTINVEIMPFSVEKNTRFEMELEKEELQKKYILWAIIAGVILSILSIIIYAFQRKREFIRIKKEEAKVIDDLLPEFEEIETDMDEGSDAENQIRQIAMQKPDEVANLIRNWIMED